MSQYIHVGILLITVPNLIVIVLMVLVFIVAIVAQLPHPPADVPPEPGLAERSKQPNSVVSPPPAAPEAHDTSPSSTTTS